MPLEGFPVQLRFALRWGEMDAFQHLNNTVYFGYFEDVRIAYFQRMKIFTDADVGPILHSTQCRFRAPLTYPDNLVVGARVPEIDDGGRFTMEYAVYSEALQAVAATGTGLIVPFDYKAKTKATLPDAWRTAIQDIEA